MTKAETVAQITDLTGIQQEKVNTVVLELLECIINALAAHEAVFIKDFGTFHCKLRNQTTGRNIRENKAVIYQPTISHFLNLIVTLKRNETHMAICIGFFYR